MSSFKKAVLATVVGMGCALAAMEAGAVTTVTGDVTVQTTLTSACEVSSGGTIDFGQVVALASTATPTADSGSTFQVACSNGLTPKLYSASARSMDDGAAHQLPFDICLSACDGSNALSTTAAGATTPTPWTSDGTLQDVKLHGRLLAANFGGLPAGNYSKTVVISVDY